MAAVLMIVLLAVGIGVGVLAGSYVVAPAISSSLKGAVPIGDLLPLTGDLASFGKTSQVATEFARDDVNAYLAASGAGWSVNLVEEDTATTGTQALSMVQTLFAQGVKLAVGPQSSGEIRAIKDYLNQHNFVVISQSSTATDLGISNDYVFRFAPNDTVQGRAIARSMISSGATVTVQIYRNDPWGQGLSTSSGTAFTADGGTVWSTKIIYDTTTGATGTAIATNTATLENAVKAALATVGNNATKVAVQLLAFDEGDKFLAEAGTNTNNAYPNLNNPNLHWFGSDGTTQSSAISSDATASAFANKQYFLNTLFGTVNSAKFSDLDARITAKLGYHAESYAFNAYDAVWVLALALQSVGRYDSVAVQKVLNTSYGTTAAPYFGASGPIRLNSAGDRVFSDYDLWIVQQSGTTWTWVAVKHYNYLTDTVINL